MARARRQPPLFEVLHEPSRRAGPGGSALSPGTGLRPVEVPTRSRALDAPPTPVDRPPPPEPPEPKPKQESVDWGTERKFHINQRVLLGTAAAIVAGVVIWIIAYNQGVASERAVLDLNSDDPPVQPIVADPMAGPPEQQRERPSRSRPAAAGSGQASAQPAPATSSRGLVWKPGTDPRRSAHNYLMIARMNFRDAEAVATFLTEHGVPAGAVPVDPDQDAVKAMKDNAMHFVIALEGFPSDSYRASEEDRKALRADVLRLGDLWNRQVGGAEDFSSSYWQRYD